MVADKASLALSQKWDTPIYSAHGVNSDCLDLVTGLKKLAEGRGQHES